MPNEVFHNQDEVCYSFSWLFCVQNTGFLSQVKDILKHHNLPQPSSPGQRWSATAWTHVVLSSGSRSEGWARGPDGYSLLQHRGAGDSLPCGCSGATAHSRASRIPGLLGVTSEPTMGDLPLRVGTESMAAQALLGDSVVVGMVQSGCEQARLGRGDASSRELCLWVLTKCLQCLHADQGSLQAEAS